LGRSALGLQDYPVTPEPEQPRRRSIIKERIVQYGCYRFTSNFSFTFKAIRQNMAIADNSHARREQ